jgi:electron transfer flavoprotein alpha subunit
MTVLCLVENDGAGPADASLRALAFARRLAGSVSGDAAGPGGADADAAGSGGRDAAGPGGGDAVLGGARERVAAVAFGTVGEPLAARLSAAGAADVYAVTADRLEGYAPQAWARALAGLIGETSATAVVAAGTDHGSEVLAHLGAITGLPMAANCVSAVRTGAGSYQLVRNRWAGSLLEDAILESAPALLTVAVDSVPGESMITVDKWGLNPTRQPRSRNSPLEHPPQARPPAADQSHPATTAGPAEGDGTELVPVHQYRAALEPGDLVAVARESAERSAGVSLATARVVVGGGRGVGGPDGFGPLEELADLLGGALGVSRVVTSQGWRPHKQQVGQTGTRISPQLYLACGISGAIQHMAGCLSAKHIVAVNTDPDAPIIARADYAVIGDLSQVIPALVAALRERSSSSLPDRDARADRDRLRRPGPDQRPSSAGYPVE